MKLPELTVTYNDAELPCRYEYDRGEEQWFDARQGVGSPGYPAGAWVTEVLLVGKWVDVEEFTQDQNDKWDQELMDKLIEYESAINAEQAQAEYDAWQEMKKWGDDMGNTQ
jgi:hypothetical protein